MELKEIEAELGLELKTLVVKFDTEYPGSFELIRAFGDRYQDSCGVYYLLTVDYDILYIGQSTQVDKRIKTHYGNRNKEGHWMNRIEFVAFRECDPSSRLKTEKEEIQKYTPKYNNPDEKTKQELLDVKKKWDRKKEMSSLIYERVMILNNLDESIEECEILNKKIHDDKERLKVIDIEIANKERR